MMATVHDLDFSKRFQKHQKRIDVWTGELGWWLGPTSRSDRPCEVDTKGLGNVISWSRTLGTHFVNLVCGRRLLFHMDLHLQVQTSQLIQFLMDCVKGVHCCASVFLCFAIRGWQRFSTWAGYGETPPEGQCKLKTTSAMLSFACSQSGSKQSETYWRAHANISAVIIRISLYLLNIAMLECNAIALGVTVLLHRHIVISTFCGFSRLCVIYHPQKDVGNGCEALFITLAAADRLASVSNQATKDVQVMWNPPVIMNRRAKQGRRKWWDKSALCQLFLASFRVALDIQWASGAQFSHNS